MIPANVFIEIDPGNIPAGPAGMSAYDIWLQNGYTGTESDFLNWLKSGQTSGSGCIQKIITSSLAPGSNTASTSYVATGLTCTTHVAANESVLIDVRGMTNHTGQNIIHFTLKRNGVDLTPINYTGLACSRIDISDGVRAVGLLHKDTPPAGDTTYELFWKCHNSGTAYLGKRQTDTAMMVPTTMTLTVFKS